MTDVCGDSPEFNSSFLLVDGFPAAYFLTADLRVGKVTEMLMPKYNFKSPIENTYSKRGMLNLHKQKHERY